MGRRAQFVRVGLQYLAMAGTQASKGLTTGFPWALILLAFSTGAFAQFSYAPINVPGAVATQARGINNSGEIVGFYKVTSCIDSDIQVPTCPTKGFKYVNGSYVTLMVPNSVSTAVMGVNDLGDLVGFYKKSDGTIHGFIWYHSNVVKTIDHPKTSFITVARAINKAGTVVGELYSTFAGQPASGWVWVNGTFSNMNPNNGVAPCCWSVNGIANSGVLTGQVFQADFNQGWFKAGSDQDFFMDTPVGLNGADTFALGVNSNTDVVGYTPTVGGWFAPQIEAREGSGDRNEVAPSFKTVAYPKSKLTVPFAVNDMHTVVGTYTDSLGKEHGFLAK